MSHIAKPIAAFKIENVPLKYQVAYVCIPFISLYLLILFPEYYSPKLERLVHGGGGGGGVNINIFVFCPTNRFLNIIRLCAHTLHIAVKYGMFLVKHNLKAARKITLKLLNNIGPKSLTDLFVIELTIISPYASFSSLIYFAFIFYSRSTQVTRTIKCKWYWPCGSIPQWTMGNNL